MSNHELLHAISNMLTPIREDIRGIKKDMQDMKSDMEELREDISTEAERGGTGTQSKSKKYRIDVGKHCYAAPEYNRILLYINV